MDPEKMEKRAGVKRRKLALLDLRRSIVKKP